MDSGIYAAYTGLLARTQALDTAANNLANVGTNGFRAQRDYFRGVMAGTLGEAQQGGSQVGNSVNGFGVLGGSRADLGQGALVSTSNPLDLALNGPGFFAVQTAHGVQYTRDGSFSRGSDGTLQTGSGDPVLNAQMKPIVVPSGTVDIAANGTLSVQTPAGSSVVDQVGMFDFKNPAEMVMQGANRFAAATGQTPVAADATVKQGAVEGSNEDSVHGTMQLILVQRQAEMLQKAMSAFDNDFDKTAVEQISRV